MTSIERSERGVTKPRGKQMRGGKITSVSKFASRGKCGKHTTRRRYYCKACHSSFKYWHTIVKPMCPHCGKGGYNILRYHGWRGRGKIFEDAITWGLKIGLLQTAEEGKVLLEMSESVQE